MLYSLTIKVAVSRGVGVDVRVGVSVMVGVSDAVGVSVGVLVGGGPGRRSNAEQACNRSSEMIRKKYVLRIAGSQMDVNSLYRPLACLLKR